MAANALRSRARAAGTNRLPMAKELSHLVRGGALHERWGKLTDGLSTVRVLSPPPAVHSGQAPSGNRIGDIRGQSPIAYRQRQPGWVVLQGLGTSRIGGLGKAT